MFWALAVIVLAFAGFSVLVIRMPARTAIPAGPIDREQLKGFVYVGAGALVVLAAAVVVVGLLGNRSARAEALAVLGLFGYGAYLVAAAVILYVGNRRA